MRKLDIGRDWARKHAWGLLMLAALLIISTFVVRHFRRPGQMSVIEAQAMDMTAMKPPVGAVPVATEVVTRGLFSAKVQYTGSVAPYTEQNIYPRVEGWLTRLNAYNGDRVRAGQLLAILDSPDIQTRLSEAAHGHAAASKEVSVARANLSRMRAERNAARGRIEAAERDLEGTRARLAAAERTVTQAEKELKSAEAALDYWRAEFKREANLLKEGAVSQQEYDSEKAQMIAAEAEVENKRARVEQTRANVSAARAEVRNKQAEVKVARDRAGAADAALSAAAGEVEQKAASADVAGAARATAATFNRYREIRAPFDGVVTKRLIHPGVLVKPGIAILNIVQIDKVRLQANVADKDLGSITLGAKVTARTLKEPRRSIRASISSISPLADQTSRTAVVEAVVDNKDHYLVPGDFISMKITTASIADAVTVPSPAITSKNGRGAVWVTHHTRPTGKITYYCTMHPEVISDKPGLCPKCNMKLEPKQIVAGKTAHLVNVTVGKTDGERTQILSGLNDGDEVIYAGHNYLKEGDFVFPTKWGKHGPAELPPPPGEAQSVTGHEGHQTARPRSEKKDSDKTAHPQSPGKAGARKYTCPMHPDFVTGDPKALCPECNMKVVPRKNPGGRSRHDGH